MSIEACNVPEAETDIARQYRERLTRILGADFIREIPKELAPGSIYDYGYLYDRGNRPTCAPSHLGNLTMVRGILKSSGRNFIACKIEILDESHQLICTTADGIFQNYDNKDVYHSCYMIRTNCRHHFFSLLPSNSPSSNDICLMEDADLENFKKILQGEEITISRDISRFNGYPIKEYADNPGQAMITLRKLAEKQLEKD